MPNSNQAVLISTKLLMFYTILEKIFGLTECLAVFSNFIEARYFSNRISHLSVLRHLVGIDILNTKEGYT